MSKRRPCGDEYERGEVTSTDTMQAVETLLLAGFTSEATSIMVSLMKNDKDTRSVMDEIIERDMIRQ